MPMANTQLGLRPRFVDDTVSSFVALQTLRMQHSVEVLQCSQFVPTRFFAQKVFTRLQKGVAWPFYRCIICKVPVVLVVLNLLFLVVLVVGLVVLGFVAWLLGLL